MEKLTIVYQDYAAIRAKALAKGMPDNADESVFDYVDPSSGETEIFAGLPHNFSEAVMKAAEFIEKDTWNCPRIFLHRWEGPKKTGHWNAVAFWEIQEGANPDFNSPDGEP